MDIVEPEENLSAVCEPKLHGGMCKTLSAVYCKVLSIFPLLEDARPRSRSGIQALCSLHIALEKAKSVLQHCSECSKLYLAITGDSVLIKFVKARSSLKDSLKHIDDIVPHSIGGQIADIVSELEGAVFSLDPLEKQVGDKIITLLQQGKHFDNSIDSTELDSFHHAATKLGIASSGAALTERRALKKLLERARVEEDKRKESIVSYLLHLMIIYSKSFKNEVSDDNDSLSSAHCSPIVHASDRQLSKLSSINFKVNAIRSMDSLGFSKLNREKTVSFEADECDREDASGNEEESENNALETYNDFLAVLNEEESLKKKCKVMENIRVLLKDDEEARVSMGANGFVEAMLRFLDDAVSEGNSSAQDIGAMALFNLAVNNTRNKEMMLTGGIIPVLEKMISINNNSRGPATALYSSISYLDAAKPVIASSQAVPLFIQQLHPETDPLCRLDSLHALFHLSSHRPNAARLLSAGIIDSLRSTLSPYTEKSIAILINLSASNSGNEAMSSMSSTPSLINALAGVLDTGEPSEQEQAVSCILALCDGNEECCEMALQEGVIPGLVALSVSGTARGREEAQRILMVFREHCRREDGGCENGREVDACLGKRSGKSMGKVFGFLWKSKSCAEKTSSVCR